MYKVENEFILHNSLKEFKDGHTHLHTLKQAKMLIEYSLHNRIPNHLSRYLLISLYRINDGEYAEKIMTLIKTKENKTSSYYFNSQKGIRKKK